MMYQKLVVPIDHGNRNMKTEDAIFTSGLVESECEPALGDSLYYAGHYYSLSGQRIPYMRDKTADERFFILTLFAIAMEADRRRISNDAVLQVELPVGLPPRHFGALYQKFGDYFRRAEEIQFWYKKIPYRIRIEEAAVFPQDYAAAMTVYTKISGYSKVLTVDIGGFTLDYLLIRESRPDLSVCESLEMGVITLYNRIISRISSEYDVLLEETDIDSIIREKRTDYEERIKKTVLEMTDTYVNDVLGALRERGLDLKTGCVVFIGGGASLLKRFLEASDRIGRSIFVEDICANAKGYGLLYQIQKRGR